jgi:hypothetical protein
MRSRASSDSAGARPDERRLDVFQYWHEPNVPDAIADLCASFPAHNPDLGHTVFDAETAGALIERRYGRRHLEAFRRCGTPPMQADYFRYCAVNALGGLYSDADVLCVGPLTPWLSTAPSGQLMQFPAGGIANHFFAFPEPGHPLMEMAVEIATVNIERRLAEDIRLVTGPGVFTGLYLLNRLGSIDAFIDYVVHGRLDPSVAPFRGSGLLARPPAQRRLFPHVAGLADAMCEVVGSYERVADAFAGVRISLMDDARDWIRHAERGLAYKKTAAHWSRHSGSIFR